MKQETFTTGQTMESILGKREHAGAGADEHAEYNSGEETKLTAAAGQSVVPQQYDIVSSFLQDQSSINDDNVQQAPLVPPQPQEANANWQDTTSSIYSDTFKHHTDTSDSVGALEEVKSGNASSTTSRSTIQRPQRKTRRKTQQQQQHYYSIEAEEARQQTSGRNRTKSKKETSAQLQKRLSHEELERIAAGEGPEARKAARQLRNRMSAAESRRKKEKEIEDLKKKASELEAMLAQKDKQLEYKDQLIQQLRGSMKSPSATRSTGSTTEMHQQQSQSNFYQWMSMPSANPAVVPVVHSETTCTRALLTLSQQGKLRTL
eukprot:gb/GECG01014279.1/.p1 GENE.gb/GECG01014279.1/~~gb/GECG01014279.1/.p1  ORF type:complete len:319 (+),score=68.49 gb/GECG01014279.1/:1-957(+)